MLKLLGYILDITLTIILNILITWLFVWIISLCFDFQCTPKLVCGIYVTTYLLKFRFQEKTNAHVNIERR